MKLKELVSDVSVYPGAIVPTVYDGIIIDVVDMILEALGLSLELTDTDLRLLDAEGELAAKPIVLQEPL